MILSTILPLPKMNLVAAILAVFASIHALGNNKLSRTARKYFSLMMLIPSISILIECIYSRMELDDYTGVIGIFTLIVMCADCFMPLLLFKACSIKSKKMHILVIALAVFHTTCEVIMYPFHLVYYISDESLFEYGPLGWFFTVNCICSILLTIHILIKLGKRFSHRKAGYLLTSVFIMILGMIFDQFDATYGAAYLMQVLGLILQYVYYSDLCTLELVNSLEESRDQLTMTLATAIDTKDKYTNGHSYRVAVYSGMLAKALGWDDNAVRDIYSQALLHDIGKIGVPDSVLNKAGRLNDTEFELIKSHTRMGGDIIKNAVHQTDAFAACRYHHERYDGTGYPDGLKGEDIPLVARIVAIADAYDAMNSTRIYRKALPRDVIRENMANGSGTQFDPALLQVFLKLFDEGKLQIDTPDTAAEPDRTLFEEEASDLLEAFEIKKEYKDSWDSDYTKFEKLNSYLEKLKGDDSSVFRMAYVDIQPKDAPSPEAADEMLTDAMNTLSGVIRSATDNAAICQRVSRHQLAVVLTGRFAENGTDSLLNSLLYFYKIYDTRTIDLSYGMIRDK